MVSGKNIAFMDFDGTITKKDSLLEFIKFQKGKLAFYTGFLLNLHWLVGYLLKLVPSDRAKQKVLNYFFAGLEQNLFQEKCDLPWPKLKFSVTIISKLLLYPPQPKTGS